MQVKNTISHTYIKDEPIVLQATFVSVKVQSWPHNPPIVPLNVILTVPCNLFSFDNWTFLAPLKIENFIKYIYRFVLECLISNVVRHFILHFLCKHHAMFFHMDQTDTVYFISFLPITNYYTELRSGYIYRWKISLICSIYFPMEIFNIN